MPIIVAVIALVHEPRWTWSVTRIGSGIDDVTPGRPLVAPKGQDTRPTADRTRETLFSILETPISPELLPLDVEGKIAHLTEAAVGP